MSSPPAAQPRRCPGCVAGHRPAARASCAFPFS